MKNVLIFGENSYIGSAFAHYTENNFENKFYIEKITSRRAEYTGSDFSRADCVLFCAGIAHRKAPGALHYSVNRDLAVSVAETAKAAGVRQFVYISSAAVFGQPSKHINAGTVPKPVDAYGKSKLMAETELKKLHCDDFFVTIIRPPMVYGRGCKGNFERLVNLTRMLCNIRILGIFPNIQNKRDMIYIGNLCFFLSDIIERRLPGTFFPQNKEPVCTSELVRLIAKNAGKEIRLTRVLNPLIALFKWLPPVKKLFGDFVYNGNDFEYVGAVGFEESVQHSVPPA